MAEFLTALLILAAALWVTVDAIADDSQYCDEHATDDRACVYGSDD
jgi:hypothetical protein